MPSSRPAGASPRHPVFALSDELCEAFAARSPVQATFAGIPGHHDAWDDYGPAAAEAWDAELGRFERRLAALPAPSDRFSRLASRVTEEWIRDRRELFAHGDHLRDLNSSESSFQYIRQVFEVMPAATEADAQSHVARLDGIGAAMDGYLASLDEGRRRGLVVARRQVRAVAEQARASAGASSYLRTLPATFAAAGVGGDALQRRLEAAVAGACGAFASFAQRLEAEVLPHASEGEAVGRERYLRAAKRFLGMNLDPIDAYEWGWSEVHAIEAQMTEVARSIRPGASLPEVIELLGTDPERAAPDRESFLRFIRERQLGALADLEGRHFDIPEAVRRVEVKIAPPGGSLGAYYVPPSEDFSRPGTIWYSVGESSSFPLYDEITTAYHEGFPGHHLQCSLQVLLASELCRLHRLLYFCPGHGEGWALYAEQLMHELGYLEKPDYVLGMLGAKLMRACRVVVDIGLHLGLAVPRGESFHPGETWSYELAVELMNRRAFLPLDMAVSEATRYLGWPAQAISYKIGEREILGLRAELERRDGARFDRKAFHAKVIGSGSVGLGLLREIVLEPERDPHSRSLEPERDPHSRSLEPADRSSNRLPPEG